MFYYKKFSLVLVHKLNIKTVLFQAIQFSISTQFSSIWLLDKTHSPKIQHYWNFTIRLFCVISRILVGREVSYPFVEKQSPTNHICIAFYVYKQMNDAKLLLLHSNTWNYLCTKKKSSGSFKNVINKRCLQILYTQPNQTI